MKIIRAEHLGMCFGVRDAIQLALLKAAQEPVTILGELVHNPTVMDSLRAQGVRVEEQAESVRTATALITAHGASSKAMDRARARGLNVLEATCPLVHMAHQSVAQLVQEGYHPVIIGKRDHVEVRGITEDLEAFDVVLTEPEVRQLTPRAKFGVAAQTTQPIERVRHLVACLREAFPASEVKFKDTVCQPTKQRQSAAVELAEQSEVVVVVGGAHSNNTRELVATCRRHCARVHHVQSAADLFPEWFAGAQVVGVTAGTSTPDNVIDGVETWLVDLAQRRANIASHSFECEGNGVARETIGAAGPGSTC